MNDIATAVQLTGQADISLQGNLIEASSVMKVLGSKLTTLYKEYILLHWEPLLTKPSKNLVRRQYKRSFIMGLNCWLVAGCSPVANLVIT